MIFTSATRVNMLFAQQPTPPTSPYFPTPSGGGGGSYLNPSNYTGLAHELGAAWFILLILVVALFIGLGFMVWRNWKQPSNASQLIFLRAMYKIGNQRHLQWQAVMRAWCSVLKKMADKEDADMDGLNDKLDELRDAIVAPPPIPENLLSLMDDGKGK